MKKCFVIAFLLLRIVSNAQVKTITPGEVAPKVNLLNIDDKLVSFDDYPSARGFIVVFMCNTCPYSKAYEARVIALNAKYSSLGFPVIAVNPNDPGSSPDDSFERMKEYATSKGYTFPYLYDEGQRITRLYGPKSTPTVFVLSRSGGESTVEYTGAIDNDTQYQNPDRINYVEDALSALLDDKKPALAVTRAIGCRVRWKQQ